MHLTVVAFLGVSPTVSGLVVFSLVGLVAVAGAIWTTYTGRPIAYLLVKSAATASFLLAALYVGFPGKFGQLLFVGLCGHAIGDVVIALKGRIGKLVFPGAIGSFLVGHVLYFLAFSTLGTVTPLQVLLLAGALVVNLSVVFFLWKRLGRLLLPGIAYGIAMSLMVSSGLTLAFIETSLSPVVRLLLGAGAVVYNLSDLAVIRERFVESSITNKLWGLPAYYGAQFVFVFAMLHLQS